MLAAQLVQLLHHREWIQPIAVQRNAVALLELQLQIFWLIRRILRRCAKQEHVFVLRRGRVEPWILQHAAFIADMQQVTVHRIRLRR
ncbi:hypothetical protein D3C81_1757120 [compost metagenome]